MPSIPLLESKVLGWFYPRSFDDVIDKLHYVITAATIAVAALVTSGRQNFGSPIRCFTPAQFNSEWIAYTHEICYAKGTFYASANNPNVYSWEERDLYRSEIYQYIPYMLAFQAVLFFIPSWVWNHLHNRHSGINLDIVLKDANAIRDHVGNNSKTATLEIAKDLEEQLEIRDHLTKPIFCGFFKSSLSCYMSVLYLFVKTLYLANALGQFYFIHLYLSVDSKPAFPLIAACDYQVKVLGTIHNYSVECALGINVLYNKIYIGLWYWLPILSAITFVNMLYSFVKTITHWNVHTLLKKFKTVPDRRLHSFIRHGLRRDGALVLSFIESNCGKRVAKKLAVQMFINYRNIFNDQSNTSLSTIGEQKNPTDITITA